MVEARPGVYRKNAQIAHIYGVRPSAPRFRRGLSDEERDSFNNLLLLCLPHHSEVDDKKTEDRYPPEVLREWKESHEGDNGPALAMLGRIDDEQLTRLLVGVFMPPIERLRAITKKLEETGTLNAQTVVELRQIVDVLADTGPNANTARDLAFAAEVLGSSHFERTVQMLVGAAEELHINSRNMRGGL